MHKQFHHLSHIDLDGYGCQLVMSYTPYPITSYNANYGAEVMERLEEIVEAIRVQGKDSVILISDLNLYPNEAQWLQSETTKLNEIDIAVEIILLDHHGSGAKTAAQYEWYFLDTERCATKIVYDYAKAHFELDEPLWLNEFVNVINAVDLWHQDQHDYFEYGKVCMRLISEARELPRVLFAAEDRNYKLTLLRNAAEMMHKPKAPVLLDEALHRLKKAFFIEEEDNTLDNLSTKKIVSLLGEKRAEMTIYYKGYRGFLSYGVGNTSIIGNGFLTTYDEYDFIVDVSLRGTMSLRGHNRVDVSLIAKEWANGGGHPNASGGRIQGFKEQFRYTRVRDQIEKLIGTKEAIMRDLAAKEE